MQHDKSFYRKGQFLTGGPVSNAYNPRLTKEVESAPPLIPAMADLEGIRRKMQETERLLEEFQALARTYRLPR
jgi:hypothetical protein